MSTAVPILLIVATLGSAACVQVQAPTDTGDPVATTAPSTGTPNPAAPATSAAGPFAYTQDVKAVLDSDCLTCHGPRRADGGYSVATYTQTMRAVRAGNAGSALISVSRSGGSMYRYWSGTTASRQTKADMIRIWIVTNGAQENR